MIWSPDELLAEEAAEEVKRAEPDDAEHVTIDAELGLDGLHDALFAGSLFATHRLVVIRNAHVLRKDDVERLADALGRDVTVDVVVTATSDRVPTRLLDALKGIGKVDRLQPPRRGELFAWVSKRLKAAGLQPGRDAAATLVECVGDGLRDLDQAISQLALRAGGRGRIDADHVLQHFSRSADQPIWVLFDAVVKREPTTSFAALQRLLAAGDAPLAILGALVSQVRGLIRAKSLLERRKGLSDGDVAKALAVSPGRAGVLRRQSSQLGWDWLLAVHRLLAEADFELKGGEDGAVLPAEAVMERVVAGALDARS